MTKYDPRLQTSKLHDLTQARPRRIHDILGGAYDEQGRLVLTLGGQNAEVAPSVLAIDPTHLQAALDYIFEEGEPDFPVRTLATEEQLTNRGLGAGRPATRLRVKPYSDQRTFQLLSGIDDTDTGGFRLNFCNDGRPGSGAYFEMDADTVEELSVLLENLADL